MATRAVQSLEFHYIRSYTVAASQTVTAGKTVALASDTTIQDAGAASDLAVGVARTSGVAGAAVEVVHFAHPIKMLVGTGGTTRGKRQKVVSDGITDAPANGTGTTSVLTCGIALQSGVVGDFVGVMPIPNASVGP